jgi:hypothetical protein
MTEPLKLRIQEPDRSPFDVDFSAPLEVGRRRTGEPEPYALLPADASRPARRRLPG